MSNRPLSKDKCPVCKTPLPEGIIFFCQDCWKLVNNKDRLALNAMRYRGQPTASKVASIVKSFKGPTK